MYTVTLQVDFWSREDEGSQGFAQLEIELPFAPTTDIEFEHRTWHNARKPRFVSYNLEDQSFFVILDEVRLPSIKDVAAEAEMYRTHGWELEFTPTEPGTIP